MDSCGGRHSRLAFTGPHFPQLSCFFTAEVHVSPVGCCRTGLLWVSPSTFTAFPSLSADTVLVQGEWSSSLLRWFVWSQLGAGPKQHWASGHTLRVAYGCTPPAAKSQDLGFAYLAYFLLKNKHTGQPESGKGKCWLITANIKPPLLPSLGAPGNSPGLV